MTPLGGANDGKGAREKRPFNHKAGLGPHLPLFRLENALSTRVPEGSKLLRVITKKTCTLHP